jgi:hypothetical protein
MHFLSCRLSYVWTVTGLNPGKDKDFSLLWNVRISSRDHPVSVQRARCFFPRKGVGSKNGLCVKLTSHLHRLTKLMSEAIVLLYVPPRRGRAILHLLHFITPFVWHFLFIILNLTTVIIVYLMTQKRLSASDDGQCQKYRLCLVRST